ncbi:MAG: Site-specific DNA recombinase SpoIVCA/DNA invertase PinE [Candidatus Alkanophagales archaeon MCA70_species_1]|nr:Site-specific DNA recombinase SpoIVCA/DNA invertase PinE [Candidatus Alkanophaga volatiphilum]
MDELKRYGVDFVSVTERIDTTTAAGKLMFHIIGAFAEFEREMTIERTKLAMDKKVKEGSFVGRLPLGYRYDESRRIVLSEDAETVRCVFFDFLETQNVSEVARKHNMSRMQVYRILRNHFTLALSTGGTWSGGAITLRSSARGRSKKSKGF